MKKYQYEPVDETASEVRFLILLPGERGDPVQGLLLKFPLMEENFPPYEAISYAWGSPDNPINVAIKTTDIREAASLLQDIADDFTFESYLPSRRKRFISSVRSRIMPSRSSPPTFGKLSVTQNLGQALPYLRLRDKPRLLWIDAICVNQKDLPERSQQVQRMADIYQRASRAVVWLGEESHNSEMALDTLEWISSNVLVDFSNQNVSAISRDPSEAHWADLNVGIDMDKEPFLALIDLFKRPWFHRLWIWQEIHLAKHETSILACGKREITWQTFRNAVIPYYLKGVCTDLDQLDDAQISDSYELKLKVYNLCIEISNETFGSIATSTQLCECSDPRDRVYALLSLVDIYQIDIKPDYTRAVELVFQEAAMNLMQKSNTLHLLASCELNPNRSNLPSWVPDFSVPKLTTSCMVSAAYSTLSQPMDFTGGLLQVKGVQISAIQKLWECNFKEYISLSETIKGLKDILLELEAEATNPSGKTISEAFPRLVILNRFAETSEPPDRMFLSSSISQEFCEYLSIYVDDSTTPVPYSLTKFFGYVSKQLKCRSIFITIDRHIGLCSIFTEIGDIVVTVVGCPVPLILRPQANGKYLVVGEAYCDGIMEGEHILGPLPSGVDFVTLQSTNGPSFKNRETGELTCDDPRLGELPMGWSRVSHDRETEYFVFLDEKTREQHSSLVFDPRTFPEELEKRGVKLENFTLA